ncbi:DUF4132 domain-containing protein [Bacteroides sp. 519]|uniref:DUF4132 domain-containing protein n=1 Tax=Bacteroides sp. 519 TaxID=2302937 RepID=UPI0013D89B21|nr:DUF4132 domain-containing protein [Bacteroides sp. 519]NDV59461.1 DUF4132 domain-containing protein [Bacteroides sp. 519]
MDYSNIIDVLRNLNGRPGAIAQAIIAYKESKYPHANRRLAEAKALLVAGSPKTTSEVYENGPRQMLQAIHGEDIANLVGKAVAQLTNYVQSDSSYRRSFRTQDVEPYKDKIYNLIHDSLFFLWDGFDILKDLQKSKKDDDDDDDDDDTLPWNIYGDILSVYIDEGRQDVIEAIKNICLGDNNTKLLNDRIILGIVKSENKELHQLLGDMLLAARLQEGLRQSILENADHGRISFLIYILKIVIDNDLLRYSSAVRAVGVWMGLAEEASEKRIVTKLAKLGYKYLNDEKARQEAIQSRDELDIYTALWAASVFEMNDVLPMITELMKGEKYQKLVALYFASQLENDPLQFAIASPHLDETDPDLLSLILENYTVNYGWANKASDFSENCREITYISDKKLRDSHFKKLLAILPTIPQNGYSSEGKPFYWCNLTLDCEEVFNKLLALVGYDFDPQMTAALIDNMSYCDSTNRVNFIKYFNNPQTDWERQYLFAALNDKSMSVRWQALTNIKELTISEEESKLIINLLSLKTGDLRQNAVEILLAMPNERPIEAIKTLLADKVENKRLAGLDMLAQLVKKKTLTTSQIPDFLALMPKVTDKEQLLIDALMDESPKYNRENGFGMYNPDYTPEFAPMPVNEAYRLKTIFDFDPKRITTIFDALCNKIHENRNYTYRVNSWDDSVEENTLGTQRWPRDRFDAIDEEDNKNSPNPKLDKYVLQDVWRAWIKENEVTFAEIFLFMFLEEVSGYDNVYSPDYLQWANAHITTLFNVKAGDKLVRYFAKKKYGELALNIIELLPLEYPEEERFQVLAGALNDVIAQVPQEDWTKSIDDESESYRSESYTFTETDEVDFLLTQLGHTKKSDEHFAGYLAICYKLGALKGLSYHGLEEEDVARGVQLGLLKIDALYKTFFLASSHPLSGYVGKITYRSCKEAVKKYPMLQTVANEVAARVIEIELNRGDTKTEVSELAVSLRWHQGAETFAKILIAMGKETFVRGYIYSSDTTKKAVLSSLLKASHPKADDNAETLRAALNGKIDDKRLLEAAMYAPAWLNIIGNYLGWPGLESAAWYFHAHINECFSAEKETEVARYSPISAEEFNNGAFDINWFKEAYKTLGAERFALLYDCTKYLTEGANHRRAQLFADATLGKLKLKELEKEIKDKRNKDKLLSYSLIPLSRNKQKDILARYEFIQAFLKESKTFGTQRRESEAKASAIALDNLARNGGYSDALRFGWSMEILKIEQIAPYFEPQERAGYAIHISIDANGIAKLVCAKDGKTLTSVPAKLKKDAYITECKKVVSSLKAQQKRAKASLEQSMVKGDTFELSELKQLLNHPVIAPLLQKLLFATGNRTGALCELFDLDDNTQLTIAHPYDLYKADTWLSSQRYAFEHKLVQPFKQIFRELYLINEDELAEKTISRRYAGHQIQPQKTVALLKGRGWTVDYDQGLQRVYYKENIIATMYVVADWFSPSDTEAPTLETVQFFDRKTRNPLPLDEIPPIIFSEVMRDVDLVVSVAHVGGVDPEASHSTIEMRGVIVRELLALLRIENATVNNRFVNIQGSLGEYTVHLGSGVVHKMGKGAINILAVQSQHRGRIFLPFADEDPRTAEIMSKVLLLAEDKKIKDPAILRQM